MSMFKEKLKRLLQKKNLYAYSLLIDKLEDRFLFASRKESLISSALYSKEPGITDEKYCNNEIIVSLTTYGNRLYEVFLTIESLMQQTCKPNKIVLWLGEDLRNTEIPVTLKKQQDRGLEIGFCKDIRSYKKLIPSLKKYPSDVIITVDDDSFYNFDLLENFISAYKENPNVISATRVHKIKMQKNGKVDKYSKWKIGYDNYEASPLIFPTGVGGILYPPGCFNDEIFNETVFFNICKYADDIWFKAMALYNNCLAQKIYTHKVNGKDYLAITPQTAELFEINVSGGMNDIQLKAVFDKYNLYERLK